MAGSKASNSAQSELSRGGQDNGEQQRRGVSTIVDNGTGVNRSNNFNNQSVYTAPRIANLTCALHFSRDRRHGRLAVQNF